MKNQSIFCTFAAIFIQSQIFGADAINYQWGLLTNNVQMSIRLNSVSNETRIGDRVELLIHLRNISTNKNDIFTGRYSLGGGSGQGLSFNVLNPSGKDVSPKYPKNYEAIHAIALVSGLPCQTNSFKFDLSTLCKFDQVGTYKIIAMQRGRLGTNQLFFTVASNPLNISVVGDK